jgi:hypothetical protein
MPTRSAVRTASKVFVKAGNRVARVSWAAWAAASGEAPRAAWTCARYGVNERLTAFTDS